MSSLNVKLRYIKDVRSVRYITFTCDGEYPAGIAANAIMCGMKAGLNICCRGGDL